MFHGDFFGDLFGPGFSPFPGVNVYTMRLPRDPGRRIDEAYGAALQHHAIAAPEVREHLFIAWGAARSKMGVTK